MDEYLMMNNIEEVKESLADITETHGILKVVCVGQFVLYGFTKKPSEFLQIIKLIELLNKDSIVSLAEVEEM